jgi:pantoate kinase
MGALEDDLGYAAHLKNIGVALERATPAIIKEKQARDGIGDVNSDAKGSGARFNAGKPDLSLIPLHLLEGEARVWAYGAKKYSRNNWMKGMAWSVPLASMLRHIAAWQRSPGEDIDPETGESHLDHISCNARMLKLYSTTYTEGDDRYKG